MEPLNKSSSGSELSAEDEQIEEKKASEVRDEKKL